MLDGGNRLVIRTFLPAKIPARAIYKPPEHLYPFASQWLDVGGYKLHYLDEGPADAPLVLMLHGNPTWSFYYRKLVLALRERYRCIVPDHIGCGLSEKPGARHYDYRLASRIADIEVLMEKFDPERPVILVVHDWGGMIGMAWAVSNPERIAGLVIMNTAAFPLPPEKPMPAALSLVRNSKLGACLVLRFNAFAGLAARVGFKKKTSKEIRKAYAAPYDSAANRIATLRFVQDIPLGENDPGFDILLNTAEHLHLFKDLPCMIAWGESDFVFDHHFLKKWVQIYPDAKVHRFADCGHYILEDGGDTLINTIRIFIENMDDSTHG